MTAPKPESNNFTRGFTLIELLVVISIIAILAGLLMTNFIGVRQRARDAQRKSDLRQIQSALELYRSDQGTYPTAVGTSDGEFPSSCGSTTSSLKSATGTNYMKIVPCDPSDNTTVYTYTPAGGGTSYTLVACLENANDSQVDSSKNSSCSTASFTVTNP